MVSGDGRYYSLPAIQIIAKLAAANGVAKMWVGVDGLMSTPAVSTRLVQLNLHDGHQGCELLHLLGPEPCGDRNIMRIRMRNDNVRMTTRGVYCRCLL